MVRILFSFLLVDTHVVTVTATDGDGTSPNNNSFYRIDSGALDKFRIDFETGEIVVETGARLDREEKSQYTLRVSATDRGNRPLTGYCNVTITLSNINDEMPQFSEAVRSTTVRENLAVGSSVLTYTATDSDDDSSLRYSCLRNLTLAYDERGSRIDAAAKGVDVCQGDHPPTLGSLTANMEQIATVVLLSV